jgi:hypothetical protein
MIVIYNGPPGSGKDDACLKMMEHGYIHLSFKGELYKEVADFYNVDYNWFMEGYAVREVKENVREQSLGWKTRREAMIYVAESVIKPFHGKDYFGKKVLDQIDPTKNYCISDAGYAEEVQPLVDAFGEELINIVQIERKGCDFSNDKRRYIGEPKSGTLAFFNQEKIQIEEPREFIKTSFSVDTYLIRNNTTLENFYIHVNHIVFLLSEKG